MNNITTKCVNGDLRVGDLVLSVPDDDYSCLVGRVLRINLLGTPEHDAETENDTDDVHVDFMEFAYSKKRIKEIEAVFSELYGYKKKYHECPIDDTIMAPETLIRITGINEKRLQLLLENEYNAACYCYKVVRDLVVQSESDNTPAAGERSDTATDIFDTIESSLTLAGYEVMDGGRDWLIIRHSKSDTDFEIKVNELF